MLMTRSSPASRRAIGSNRTPVSWCEALPGHVPARAFPDHALLAEWIGQLSADLGGDYLIVHTVIVRQPVLRHAERAEEDVPEREGACEIGIAALFERGVMPAMEHRR